MVQTFCFLRILGLGGYGPIMIWGHIMKCFGLYCVRKVYFVCKSTESHYMGTECQIILSTAYFS